MFFLIFLFTLFTSGCGWDLEDGTLLTCGDGKKAVEEECDGTELGGATCKSLGYSSGTVACTSACKIDPSNCNNCGNAKLDSGEACDGTALASQACKDQGFEGGTLKCKADCSWFDTSDCYRCGDGKITGTDQCDGTELGGKKCKDQGFEGGTLKCKTDCKFDTAGCYKCGDHKVTGTDTCDGLDLTGKTCSTFGYEGGVLACKKDCTWYDVTGCYKCGDGKITGKDVCDGTALGGKKCTDLGWDGGTLKCKTDCSWFDETLCYRCGDGKKNGSEACDGVQLGSDTCQTQGFVTGKLACSKACALDTSSCSPYYWSWAFGAGGIGVDKATDVAVDSAGNSYVTGFYRDKVTIGSTNLTSADKYYDALLYKLDKSGKPAWVLTGSGSCSDQAYSVHLTAKGKVFASGPYSCGIKFGSTTLTPKPGSVKQYWLARASTGGAWEMAMEVMRSDSYINVWGMASDSAGNLYLAGPFAKNSEIAGTSVTSKGNWDGYLVKLGPDGKQKWLLTFGGYSEDLANGIAIAPSGDIYMLGGFSSTITVGGHTLTHPSPGFRNVMVLKLSSAGKVLWARSLGGDWNDTPAGLGVDGKGDARVFVSFSRKMTVGGQTYTPSSKYGYYPYDVFLGKLDSTGKWVWGTTGGGKYTTLAQDLAVDSNGNSFLLFKFTSVVSFGGKTVLGQGDDALIAKVDTSGKTQWAARAGGPGDETLDDLIHDGNKHLYISGKCMDWSTFGTHSLSVTPYNVADMCTAKMQVAP